MTAHQLSATPHFTGEQLVLGPVTLHNPDGTLAEPTCLALEGGVQVVRLPANASLRVRLNGFTDADGTRLAIDASGTVGLSTSVAWSSDSGAAISPEFASAGDLRVQFAATTATARRGTATTVTIRIDKGGKPGDEFLLTSFPPR